MRVIVSIIIALLISTAQAADVTNPNCNGPFAFSPTDQSGASLSFTAVDVQYVQCGKIVQMFGTMTYPSTVSAANTSISLPVATTASTNRGGTPGIAFTSVAVTGQFGIIPTPNGSTATFNNLNGLTAYKNSDVSTSIIRFFLQYNSP